MTAKPRIRKIEDDGALQRWVCNGLGVEGVGFDPATSYAAWYAQRAWLLQMQSIRSLAKHVGYSHD